MSDHTENEQAVTLDLATSSIRLGLPKRSNWKCYLFGSDPDGDGLVYIPSEGNVPNWFIRWMMQVCLGCTWVKTSPIVDTRGLPGIISITAEPSVHKHESTEDLED